ncbi:MAG: MBL fold metallo-hydrolase [Desulfobacteraceae bacterium]|nr:MBL fold metallo-hydrolase [Desulfobacteraceae bacterium]
MDIKWLGAAGFQISTGQDVFLLDPYLSRNPRALPRQNLTPSDLPAASRIFITHGHFDHILDVPPIARQTEAHIYCAGTAADSLIRNGVDERKIKQVSSDEAIFKFPGYSAQAFFSSHVRFDLPLVLGTLKNIHIRFFRYLPLVRNFPCGQVLSWRFHLENRIIQFFGSAGSSPTELEKLGALPMDILMIPLQGHSDICRIGLDYVRCLKPAVVIPHHHDDFFPPISKSVDIGPFVDGVKKYHPKTKVILPAFNRPLTL